MIKKVLGYCPKSNDVKEISIEYMEHKALENTQYVKMHFDCKDSEEFNCSNCPIYDETK
jgi:hypothetical protein